MIANMKIKLTRTNIMFYIAYVLLIVYRIIKSSTIGFEDHGLSYIIIAAIFVIKIINSRVKIVHLFISIIMIFLVFFNVINASDAIIPIVFLAILSAKDMEFGNIVAVSFKTAFPLVLTVVFLALIGTIENTVSYRYFSGVQTPCYGMGFNHSSALPTYCCFMYLEYIYLKNEKLSTIDVILWNLIGFIVFKCCAQRLRFFMLIIISVFLIFRHFFEKIITKNKMLAKLSFIILEIVSIIVGYSYDSNNILLNRINILLSNRLYLENYAFKNYTIPIFGQNIKMGEGAVLINNVSSYFYLDSGYIYIIFAYGILMAITILLYYSINLHKSIEKKEYMITVWLLIIAIDSLIGNQLLSIWISPIPFYYLAKDRDYKKNKINDII